MLRFILRTARRSLAFTIVKEADFRRVRMRNFSQQKLLHQLKARQLSRGGLFSSFLEQLGFVVQEFLTDFFYENVVSEIGMFFF